MTIEQQPEEHKALPPSAQMRPALEQNPGETPTVFASTDSADVQFVLAVYAQCVAQDFAKGGDGRYKAQSAMVQARQALGVLVALGIMESHTTIQGENGTPEPLWKSPAVPPMGTQSTRNATLQG